MVDGFASARDVRKSTVDFAFDRVTGRRMASSADEMGANRTLMLVVVREAAGLPFECAHPVVPGFCSQHPFIVFTCGIIFVFRSSEPS